MAKAISGEFLLTAACCRWPPNAERNSAIRTAAAGIDWRRFLRVTVRHRVVGLVHHGLRRAAIAVPRDISSEIAAAALDIAAQNLRLAAAALQLDHLFSDAGISLAIVKGAPLAMHIYGDLAVRHSNDIDLLVEPGDHASAIALLEGAGYRRFKRYADPVVLQACLAVNKHIELIHPGTGTLVELHWRLFTNPHLLPAIGDAERWTTASLPGGALRTLGSDDLFAYLCAHGAGHGWSRLKWLADVAAFLAATNQDGIRRLYRGAAAKGVEPAAAQAMLLSARFLGTPLPPDLTEQFARSRIAGWLEREAICSMTIGGGEIEPHEVRYGTTRIALAGLLVAGGWRYRLAAALGALRSEDDRKALPLPGWLHFLYPLLRIPLWFRRRVVRSGRAAA